MVHKFRYERPMYKGRNKCTGREVLPLDGKWQFSFDWKQNVLDRFRETLMAICL